MCVCVCVCVCVGCDALMPGPLVFILTLFGVFLGFLFSLFTCIMFCTQIHAICTDETVRHIHTHTHTHVLSLSHMHNELVNIIIFQGIESLKKESRQKQKWYNISHLYTIFYTTIQHVYHLALCDTEYCMMCVCVCVCVCRYDSLSDVFGEPPSVRWLSPFTAPNHPTLHRRMLVNV